MGQRCQPCEDHAQLHRGNVLGLGPQNDPCVQCEAHAKMHSSDGCSLFMVAIVTCAAAVLAIRKKP